MEQLHKSNMKLNFQSQAKLYAKLHVIRRAFAPIASVLEL